MNKRMKHVHRGALAGEGVTLTDAKTELNSQIDVALDGSYEPKYFRIRDYGVVLYRTLHGWQYAYIEPTGRFVAASAYYQIPQGDIEKHARFHVGQNLWTVGVNIPAFIEEIGLTGTSHGAELTGWMEWQERYAAARSRGLDDAAAREEAGRR